MHRTLVFTSLTVLALASSVKTSRAQATTTRDSVAHTSVDMGPVVDTASRQPRRNAHDVALGGCALRSQSPVGYVLPLFCAARLNGLIDRAQYDSVTFVGNDREIRFAVGDVRALNRFNHDRRMRKLSGALIGGGIGFFGAMIIGTMKGYGAGNQGFKSDNNGPSVGNALIFGGMGALAGALTGSRYSGNFPPYLADAQH